MTTRLSPEALELLNHVAECDGAEVPSEFWPQAEELVRVGYITLSGARGPHRMWRRAELVKIPVYKLDQDRSEL